MLLSAASSCPTIALTILSLSYTNQTISSHQNLSSASSVSIISCDFVNCVAINSSGGGFLVDNVASSISISNSRFVCCSAVANSGSGMISSTFGGGGFAIRCSSCSVTKTCFNNCSTSASYGDYYIYAPTGSATSTNLTESYLATHGSSLIDFGSGKIYYANFTHGNGPSNNLVHYGDYPMNTTFSYCQIGLCNVLNLISISVYYVPCSIDHCNFFSNNISGYLFNYFNSNITVSDCAFIGNSNSSIYNFTSSPMTFLRCTFDVTIAGNLEFQSCQVMSSGASLRSMPDLEVCFPLTNHFTDSALYSQHFPIVAILFLLLQ